MNREFCPVDESNQQESAWASLIQKLVPLTVSPLLYGLVSLTAGPLINLK